jgi:anaerobic magnesium-protoporphyrin IX monomethyl ester cyclase
MDEGQQFKGGRLNSVLGKNELRDYLANKEETGVTPPSTRPEAFFSYGKPLDHPPRVLLIAPRITIPQGMVKRVIPPLGLSYIAGSLEAAGIDVKVIDCTIEGYEQEETVGNLMTYGLHPQHIAKAIEEYDPDVIGVSVLFSTDLMNLFETCRIAKTAAPRATVVVGGLHATIYPKEIFELDRKLNDPDPSIDFVIRGEGEHRLIRFVRALCEGKVDANADGLVGFKNGDYFCNYQVTTIANLDTLPFPAYHLLPMEKYFEINLPFSPVPMGDRVAQILTSRGCPIGCTFCASTNMYKKFRVRSVENVIAEISQLKKAYQIDEIQFADDNLTLDREHSVRFFTELTKLQLKWCTPNGTMVNTLSPDLLDLMARSGLYQITLSLDSGNIKTLKNLHHKPVDLSRIPVLIEKAKEYGIFTHGTLVVGMPGESIDDIKEGFEYVMDNLTFTSISTFIAAAIPGSELYHQALERGLIVREEAYKIDTTRSRIQLSDLDAGYLEALVMDFQKRFSEKAKTTDPAAYAKKYKKLIARGRMPVSEHYGGRLT